MPFSQHICECLQDGSSLAENVLKEGIVNKYNMGPEIRFASAVRSTIYIWVSTLLAVI